MKARDSERSKAAVIALDSTRNAGFERIAANRVQRSSLLSALGLHRLPDALAHELAQDAAKSGYADIAQALATALEIRMQATPIDYVHSSALMLRGLQGAGKSTVAAKIAVQAHLTGRHVKVIAIDPNALPLQRPAKELGIKLVHARSAQAIARAVAEMRSLGGLAVIDTQGFNPRNARARAAFAALGQIEDVQSIGVVSALFDAAEMDDIVAAMDVQSLVVTGLDLIRRAGALAVAATHRIPVAHVARSPFAGDGLEPITPLALAQMLVGLRVGLR